MADEQPVSAHPTFAEATKVWATIGFLSFGGPAGQIALMHRMLVEERKWISEPRFLHALNFCMLLARAGGAAARHLCRLAAPRHARRHSSPGRCSCSPASSSSSSSPRSMPLFHETAWLDTLFFGLKAAVLAIVLEAVMRIGRRALKTQPRGGHRRGRVRRASSSSACRSRSSSSAPASSAIVRDARRRRMRLVPAGQGRGSDATMPPTRPQPGRADASAGRHRHAGLAWRSGRRPRSCSG